MSSTVRPSRFKNPWASEAELAQAVREALEAAGWIVHPECCGFDLYAVAPRAIGRAQAGDHLGVHCKLDAGPAAINR